MSRVAVKGSAYCLAHTPELGLHYGSTPYNAAEGEKEGFVARVKAIHVQQTLFDW